MKASMQVRQAFCWVVLICCRCGGAQQAPEPQPAPPRFVVNVNRVLVPVVVRDKHGLSINDLKKEDFQVLDNGKPRAVSGFTVENRGALLANAASGETLLSQLVRQAPHRTTRRCRSASRYFFSMTCI